MLNTFISNRKVKLVLDSALIAFAGGNTSLVSLFMDRLQIWLWDHANGTRDIEDYDTLYSALETLLDLPTSSDDDDDDYVWGTDPICNECGVNLDRAETESGICYTCKTIPLLCTSDEHDEVDDYYDQCRGEVQNGAGDVSRDDVNRHQREAKLGFAPPSADWAEAHRVIRCIWPNQILTRPIDKDNEWFLFAPAITPLDIYYGRIESKPVDFTDHPDFGSCSQCLHSAVIGSDEPCGTCLTDCKDEYWAPECAK